MSRLDDINEILDEKYGSRWNESDITEEEAREWLEACYEHYEEECELMETYGGMDTDENTFGYGKPFEVIRHVDYNDDEYAFSEKPLWIIEIDNEEVAAYPDEIFYD